MEWTQRETGRRGDGEKGRQGEARRPRATWAAVGLAVLFAWGASDKFCQHGFEAVARSSEAKHRNAETN